VLLSVGTALMGRSHLRDAATLLREAHELATDEQLSMDVLAALAMATRLDVGHARAYDEVRALLDERVHGDTPADRAAICQLAYDESLRGTPRDAVMDLAERGLALPDVEDPEITRRPSYFLAVLALSFCEAFALATAALDRAALAARRSGNIVLHAATSNYRAGLAFRRGDLASAVSEADATLEAMEQGWRQTLPGVTGVRALALLEQGAVVDAERSLRLPAGTWEPSASYSFWLFARARVRLARGDDAGALHDLLECRRRQDAMGAATPATVGWQHSLCLLLARRGDLAEALDLNARTLEIARRFGAPGTLAATVRTRSALVTDEDEKIALADEAVAIADASECVLEQASAHYDRGALARRHGALHVARAQLRTALARADACGAEPLAEMIRDEIKIAGGRPRRRAVAGPEALTVSEERVVRMAASGTSNREIAESLFVTVKAVEYHLSNAYRKLGISRRSELAHALASHR
jgi:DNA-binding CsgD family transcriptional regulator